MAAVMTHVDLSQQRNNLCVPGIEATFLQSFKS